jgi:hypothetical protein
MINRLLSVKFIISILLTLVFCYLSVAKVISGQEFTTIYTLIVGFYFGQSVAKKQQQ